MRIHRFLAGALFGGTLLSLAAPAAASSSGEGGFCREYGDFICCCSLDDDGRIIDCRCVEVRELVPVG